MYVRPSDRDMARMALACLPADWDVWLILEPGQTLGLGHKELARGFKRGGTLNGKDCLMNMATIYAEAAEGVDRVIKLDADTLLFDTSWLLKDGVCGVAHHVYPGTLHGLAYSFPAGHAAHLPVLFSKWAAMRWSADNGEDVAFGITLFHIGGPDNRITWGELYWERYDGKAAGDQHLLGHYRWREGARKAGAKTDEEVAAMSLSTMERDFKARIMRR